MIVNFVTWNMQGASLCRDKSVKMRALVSLMKNKDAFKEEEDTNICDTVNVIALQEAGSPKSSSLIRKINKSNDIIDSNGLIFGRGCISLADLLSDCESECKYEDCERDCNIVCERDCKFDCAYVVAPIAKLNGRRCTTVLLVQKNENIKLIKFGITGLGCGVRPLLYADVEFVEEVGGLSKGCIIRFGSKHSIADSKLSMIEIKQDLKKMDKIGSYYIIGGDFNCDYNLLKFHKNYSNGIPVKYSIGQPTHGEAILDFFISNIYDIEFSSHEYNRFYDVSDHIPAFLLFDVSSFYVDLKAEYEDNDEDDEGNDEDDGEDYVKT